jgi:hypothetical protein
MDALACENILTRRANHRHYSNIAQLLNRSWPCQTGCSARLQAENPDNLYRLATANDRLRVAVPRALALRVSKEIST